MYSRIISFYWFQCSVTRCCIISAVVKIFFHVWEAVWKYFQNLLPKWQFHWWYNLFHLFTNFVFIFILIIYNSIYRKHYTKVHSGAIKSCWESSIYEKSSRINVPEPTYQELDLKENPYQNTKINWKKTPVCTISYAATMIALTLSHKFKWIIRK